MILAVATLIEVLLVEAVQGSGLLLDPSPACWTGEGYPGKRVKAKPGREGKVCVFFLQYASGLL